MTLVDTSQLHSDRAEALHGRFRDTMSGVATPVTVISALEDGRPHGTTVSAFASLSMDPPMVMIALDRNSNLLPVIRRTQSFGVNVLGADHHGVAAAFARKGDDKFRGVDWTLDRGVPRLGGAIGWLRCDVDSLVPGGDHFIVQGLVLDAQQDVGAPLTYRSRAFGTHVPFAD